MPGKHVCQFGDRFCGYFGYDDLCEYCKKKYDLELSQRDNQMDGERAMRRREANDMANEAIGEFIAEHPLATLGGLLALGLGVGIAAHQSDKPTKRPQPRVYRGPLKKR
jgi:hypothetical protein